MGIFDESLDRRADFGGGQGAEPALMMPADEERTLRSIAKKAGIPWAEYISDYAKANPQMRR